MATIEFRKNKHGNISANPWRAGIRKKGFPPQYKSFRTEKEARDWAEMIERGFEISKNMDNFPLPELPLSVWIERWRKEVGPSRSSFSKELRMVDFWNERLGREIAIKISPTIIEGYADDILKMKSSRKGNSFLSHETRRKYLLVLSSIYGHAMRVWKWALLNPLASVNMIRREDSIGREVSREVVAEFDSLVEDFVGRVRKEMKSRGIFQREAAKLSNMNLSTFQHAVLKNKNLNLKTMVKILNGFGLLLKIEEKEGSDEKH